jgi:hypothetical protein
MTSRDHGDAYNRDEELKPGRPPRSAYDPKGSKGSERSSKTRTDPASGAPRRGGHAPDRSTSEDRG